MPNHVTTTLTITGPAPVVAELLTRHFKTHDDGRRTLDFQTLVPMPAILAGIEASSCTEDAIEALTGDRPDPYGFRAGLTLAQRAAHEARLAELTPAELDMGRRALAARAATGCTTWYDWNVAHWGTKWNAYDGDVIDEALGDAFSTVVCRFNTAWSTPEPIYNALAARYPAIHFTTDAYDEGGMFATHGVAHAGFGLYIENDVEVDDLAYAKAYGTTRDDDEDDDEVNA